MRKSAPTSMTDTGEFFGYDPVCCAVFDALRIVVLERYPSAEILRQKTCLSFRDPRPFLYVSPVKGGRRKQDRRRITLSFALDLPVPDERIRYCVQVTPNRYTHHVELGDPEEIDDQLLLWIDMAYRLKRRTRS